MKNIKYEYAKQIRKIIKRVAEDVNLDLAGQVVQQNMLELTTLNSRTVYKGMIHNPLHIINSQLNANSSSIKIDLNFLEAPLASGCNCVNIQQKSPEWLEIRTKKIVGFYDKEGFGVLNLLGFYGKTKFETTWNIVKNGTAEPKMKHIKNISRGHLTEDDVAIQFECITKCKTARCESFHFAYDMRYGSSTDALGLLK